MNNGMGSMFDLSRLVCSLWGCVKIYQGTFTYGSLAAMIQLAGLIRGPIANAVGLISRVYGAIASAERLQDVPGLPDGEQGETLTGSDTIELKDVSFRYAAVRAACPEDPVKAIGMDARPGERGIGLSEGRAQRAAVARALLSGAPIL